MTEPTLFQITLEMVACSTTLTKEDIGLWCYIVKGRYHGFTATKRDAYLSYKLLCSDEVKLRD